MKNTFKKKNKKNSIPLAAPGERMIATTSRGSRGKLIMEVQRAEKVMVGNISTTSILSAPNIRRSFTILSIIHHYFDNFYLVHKIIDMPELGHFPTDFLHITPIIRPNISIINKCEIILVNKIYSRITRKTMKKKFLDVNKPSKCIGRPKERPKGDTLRSASLLWNFLK